MTKIIDLTQVMTSGMRGYQKDTAKTKAREGWNASTLTLYSHTGTHMDAPLHFIDGGNTIENLDLEKCVGTCQVIDLRPVAPRELIDVARLGEAAQALQKGARIILRTGWDKHIGTAAHRDDLPRISKDLAELMAKNEIAFIGVEPPSVADVNNIEELTEVHEILLGAEIVIAEGLCNLDQLSRDEVEIFALPLKPEGGDGCPARVIAIER